ncbi:hypothetical protein [Bradyrhizobium forestalis]|nr:hypothetical protein [Bradyrhizobium forestalis]
MSADILQTPLLAGQQCIEKALVCAVDSVTENHGEGISRAGANSVFHSVEADHVRASVPITGEIAELAEKAGLPSKKTGGGWGWGQIQTPRAFLKVPGLFRGLPQKFRSTSSIIVIGGKP